ncbi:hypothetical protein LIER_39437 [Lithospermum erythrorhizon]|uniref:Uncharacterized protein n=1 Tax=Lithospermum erythrorhizon TaxID=34254 RepID=A0AAV3QHB1_LITER
MHTSRTCKTIQGMSKLPEIVKRLLEDGEGEVEGVAESLSEDGRNCSKGDEEIEEETFGIKVKEKMESVGEKNEDANGECCPRSNTCQRSGSPSKTDIGLEMMSCPRSGPHPWNGPSDIPVHVTLSLKGH